MKTFNYEWWVVSIHFTNGTVDCEFKGKNKENIIRQIKKKKLKKSIAEKEDISHRL